MEYLIPVILVVAAIGGFVTFLVLNATKKSGPVADRADEGAPGIGQDETPLGDTSQHAGEQTEGGATASDPESGAGERPVDPDAAAHLARPGEGEGEERLKFDGERLQFDGERPRRDEDPDARADRLRREQARPASERLADRDA